MFEVDVKNVTEEEKEGEEGDQLGFGSLITLFAWTLYLPSFEAFNNIYM